MSENIGIIGAGNMGSALYTALIKEFNSQSIYICDQSKEKLDQIDGKNKFTSDQIKDFFKNLEIVILAVKPQSFTELAESITDFDLSKHTIISIMAGVSVKNIQDRLSAPKVVRAMPNLAVKYQEGFTGWFATPGIDQDLIKKIFSCTGQEIQVENEDQIDTITALSGSGPAYFFNLSETLAESAQELGFSKEQSEKIAKQTLIGSAETVKNSPGQLSDLREAVTSKGGTTEAALKHLKENSFDQIFKNAINKAKDRAKELNN